eukprot:11388879-Prorocentrum_lima.AAC.1
MACWACGSVRPKILGQRLLGMSRCLLRPLVSLAAPSALATAWPLQRACSPMCPWDTLARSSWRT